jgi:hypothetical protein
VAILFPREMSLYEPLEVDAGGRHRMDLLGWYQQFTDLGWHVDIVHPRDAIHGGLAGYRHLVLPTNSLEDLADDHLLEAAVRDFVTGGGDVWHGPGSWLARKVFGIQEEAVDFDAIGWDEDIIPHGWSTVAFTDGVPLARYLLSGRTALAEYRFGTGRVLSFGFQFGYAYCRSTMPVVPACYGKREMHPVVLLQETPVAVLAGRPAQPVLPPIRGVECARFGSRAVIVNHRSSPISLGDLASHPQRHLVPSAPGWLAAHGAVVIDCGA